MVTAIVGRTFVAHYNQKYHTDLSARQFFEQVYFQLFYNHAKYLQWLSNSPFVQMKKGQKPHLLSPVERVEKLGDLVRKVEAGATDASIAIGYPASEDSEFATTSGQVTDLKQTPDEETVYYSWIGSGFGVGVSGGQILLFDHPLILETLFAGWQHYRDFLNDPAYDSLPGNKINTWNGQWLSHTFSTDYRESSLLRDFLDKAFGIEPAKDIEIKTQSWLNVLLGVARKLPVEELTGYVYKMGQTNSTFGFIPFRLAQLQRPEQIYRHLFGEGEYQNDRDKIRTLYGTAKSFQRICEMGAVGVAALEPKGLRDIMQGGKNKPTDDITFKTYITWLLAMLNNDDSWEEVGRATELLLRYETTTKRNKDLSTVQENQVEAVRSATSKKQFIDALAQIMMKANETMLEDMEALGKKIHNMPTDNFAYFQALLRLRYARQSREKDPQ